MSRGILDESDAARIYPETPDLSELAEMVLSLTPDFLSSLFPHNSHVPLASICFNDALHTLQEASYALSEIFAHRIWYLEKKDPPNEAAATFFGRFYAADAALRLYSSGEQFLVDAIKEMLEIGEKQLTPYKAEIKNRYKVNGVSQRNISKLEILSDFLTSQASDYTFTNAITNLTSLKEWETTIEYRNRWVHEQPPTVKGLGIVYKRGKRWKLSSKGEYTLGIGGGDKPEYSVEDLVGFIKPSLFQYTETLISVVKFYVELLEAQGFTLTFNKTSN